MTKKSRKTSHMRSWRQFLSNWIIVAAQMDVVGKLWIDNRCNRGVKRAKVRTRRDGQRDRQVDGQSEITGSERKTLRVRRMQRRPDARRACSGKVYGLRAEQKKATKKRRRISFSVSFQPARNSLVDVLTVIKKKKSRCCWFLQAHCQRWYEESAPLSPAVNPTDSRWATERHLQDIWYCIFHLRLWAQLHHHRSAVAQH